MKQFLLNIFLFVFVAPFVLSAQSIDSTFRLPTANIPSGTGAINGMENDLQKPFKTILAQNLKNQFKLPVDTSKKKKKAEFHAKVFTDVNYTNTAATPPEYNGVYTTVGFAPSIKLFGLPFSGQVSLTMQNNQVRFDYTTASAQFDMDQYKDQLKEKYLNYMSDINHFFPANEAEQVTKLSDTMKRLGDCQKMISSPDYDKQLNGLISKSKLLKDTSMLRGLVPIDTCNEKLDTCDVKAYKAKLDSLKKMESKYYAYKKALQDSIKELQSYAKDYNTAQQYVNSHLKDLKKLEQYQSYLSMVKNSSDITQIPGVSKELNNKGIVDDKLKFFTGIQKLSVGKVSLNYSPFTLSSQNIYGFNIEYLIKSLYFVGGGLGTPAAFNLGFSPQFFAQAPGIFSGLNRFIAFFRVGLGSVKGNHLHLIYYSYEQKFGAVNNYAPYMPPANSVLSLEFQQSILKDLKFSGEAAMSNSSFLNRSASFLPLGKQDSTKSLVINYALRAALDGTIKKTGTTLGAKFQFVSNNFSTVGNPFLLTANVTSSINAKQILFDNRLTTTDILTYSIIGLQQPGFTNASLLNNLTATYKPGTKMNFTCTYMYMKQLPMGNNENPTNFNTQSVSLVQQYNLKIKKVKITTAITSTFNMSNNQSAEFSSSYMSIQNGLKETLTFPKGITFSPGAGLILNNAGLVNNNALQPGYWVEAGNTYSIKGKVTLQYTGRYTIDNIYGNNLNASGSITAKVYKTLQANAKCMAMLYRGPGVLTSNQSLNFGGGLSYSW